MVTIHPNTLEAIEAEKKLSGASSALALVKVVSDQIAGILHIEDANKSQEQIDLEGKVTAELADLNHATNIASTTAEVAAVQSKIIPPLMANERLSLTAELRSIYEDASKKIHIASDRPLIEAVMRALEDINNATPDFDSITTDFENDITLHDTSANVKVTNPWTKPCKVRFKSNGAQGYTTKTLQPGNITLSIPVTGTSTPGKPVSVVVEFYDENDPAIIIPKTITTTVTETPVKLEEPDIAHPRQVKVGNNADGTLNNPIDGATCNIVKMPGNTPVAKVNGHGGFSIDKKFLATLGEHEFKAISTDKKNPRNKPKEANFKITVEMNDETINIPTELPDVENGKDIQIPVNGAVGGLEVALQKGGTTVKFSPDKLASGKNENIYITDGLAGIDTKVAGSHTVQVILTDPNTGETVTKNVRFKIKEAPLKLVASPSFEPTDLEIKKGDSSAKVKIKGPAKKGTELILSGAGLSDFRHIIESDLPAATDTEEIQLSGISVTSDERVRGYFRDPNDQNNKSGMGNFTIKVKKLNLTDSPKPDPSTIKTQIGKTDALAYTVKNVQPGEEIVVKGPNGFEYVERIPDGITIPTGATSIDYPISLSGLDTAEKGVKQLTFMRRDPNDHTKCSPVGRASYEVKDKDNLKIKEDINKPKVAKVSVEHNATEVIATLENPVPGSKVTITGGGITKTVTVPHNHPEVTPATTPPTYESLEIKLDGFPTKEADKVTNMTVTVSDPSDENIKSTSAFDVEVGHDRLHEDHTYRLDEKSLRDAKSGDTYTIYQDGKAETYDVSSSKRWLGFGWKAQVPVLKGEAPKNITARTKTGLIEAVRTHCKDLEKRVHTKSHGEHHDNHEKKDHKEGEDHAKGEKKDDGDTHEKKESNAGEETHEKHDVTPKGFFGKVGSWLAAPFKGAWKYTPKFIKVPLAGTAKVTRDTALAAGAVWGVSSGLGLLGYGTASVFTGGLIAPVILGTVGISTMYRLLKTTGWIKAKKTEEAHGSGDAHAHKPAGH